MADSSTFAARRNAYLAALGPNAVAVVASLPERLRNGDSYHRFRQHSDLYYLTGFAEPQAVAVLRPGAEKERFVLFVRPKDPEMEVWDGRRAGIEGARSGFGADVAYPIAELETRLGELIANHDELHYSVGLDEAMDLRITSAIARLRKSEKRGRRPPRAIVDPRGSLHEQRLRKSPDELAALRTAARISSDAHVAAMKAGRPGVFEYELEAVIDFTFRKHGGTGPGYSTIVGAGDNATILHYVENNRALGENDLVLIDAGCEYDYYTGDITRTWPSSGRFTPAQRRVYEVVLSAQKQAIEMSRPGVTLDEIHQRTCRLLTEGMIELGLLAGPVDARIADASFKQFYMHGTSHWLGMDVHDVGAYTRSGEHRRLEPGMVITIEPGLYIPATASSELRGIGVRIEDDLLITEAGNEVLTAACPKEVADLERVCAR